MARFLLLTAAVTCLTLTDAIYTKNSPVLQVTGKTYDSLIAQSNHTSIVEFYAPWCGHCQNLKPAYEKAAKSLAGLAKVAAIDCDEEANKPICGQMGVQGFPTLKIVKPRSKPGRPVVEDYNGPRSAKAIVEAVKDKIPNHVKRLQGSALDTWLKDGSSPAKAVVFTEKGTTNPLVKSLAIDFLGTIGFAQVKDKATASDHGVTDFPTILLVPAPGDSPIPYKGDISRDSLLSFFSQVASPNPDPAPQKQKTKSAKPSKKPKASSSVSSEFSRASEAHKSSDSDDYLESSGTRVTETPTESPIPIVDGQEKPVVVPAPLPTIPKLTTAGELEEACLKPKSGNCILIILPAHEIPAFSSVTPSSVLAGFAEIVDKYNKRKADVIPMYAIPADNGAASGMRVELGIGSEDSLEIIALNVKRGWWRHYSSQAYDVIDLEAFIDAIKLGEGSKQKLPPGFGGAQEVRSKSRVEAGSAETESSAETSAEPEEAAADVDAASSHDEL